MPFDSKTYQDAPVTDDPSFDYRVFTPRHDGLRKLAWVLRHPEVWPKGHTWNYNSTIVRHECGTFGCAMGVARLMWPAHINDADVVEMGDKFEMLLCDAGAIFYEPPTYGKTAAEVTPLDVADAIDRYLAAQQEK